MKFISAAFQFVIFTACFFASCQAWAIMGERPRFDDKAANSVVLIIIGNKHTCSGIVFGKDKILTTAHCVSRKNSKPINPKGVRVFYTADLYKGPSTVRDVARVVMHPTYREPETLIRGRKPATLDAIDIAVLTVSTAHPDSAVPVVIPKSYVGSDVTASVGVTENGSERAVAAYGFGPKTKRDVGVLRRALMKAPPVAFGFMSVFSDFGTLKLSATQGKGKNKEGVCFGDSGGGVFFVSQTSKRILTRDNRPVLAGIIFAKEGRSRCSGGDRMVLSEVFHDWIVSQ